MTIFELYKQVISTRDYVLSGMEMRIETMYAQGAPSVAYKAYK